MILPRLYSAETTDFSNNGIGTLSDAIECKVTQGFGSSFLEMKYPVDGHLFEELQAMRIIFAQPEPDAPAQPYSIYRMKKTSRKIVYFYARHVCYNLDGWIVAPFVASSLKQALERLSANTAVVRPSTLPLPEMTQPKADKYKFNYTFETNIEAEGDFFNTATRDIWSVLGKIPKSILEIFGGEIEFDGYTVRILEHIGADKGVSIRYGKNLISLEQEENFSKCYSGIVGYYHKDSRYIQSAAIAPGKHPVAKFLPVNITEKFSSETVNPAVVELATNAYLSSMNKNIFQPEVSITVQLSTLRTREDYNDVESLEKISIGDTVHVYFPQMDITSVARVSQTVYDCLRGQYDSMTIGSEKKNVADVIENQQRQINRIKG